MIPGIVAAAGGGAGSSLDDAIVTIDFINGIYRIDTVNYSLGQVVDLHTAANGVTSNGLEILNNNPSSGVWPVEILPPFSDALLTYPYTAVIEFTQLSTSLNTTLLWLQHRDWFTGPNESMLAVIGESTDYFVQDHSDTFGDSRFNSDVFAYGTGLTRIAVTASLTKLAMSVNGRAVQVDAPQSLLDAPVLHQASFGGVIGHFETFSGSFYVRSLKIYDEKSDAELVVLSTL